MTETNAIADLCVLIPARNEAVLIGQCIESVLDAGILPMDIVVVDDCSVDKTAEIAKKYAINVLLNETNIGKAASIQRAIMSLNLLEHYKYLALLDGDTCINSNFFSIALKRLGNNSNIVLLSGCHKSVRYNWLTAYRSYVYFFSHLIYKPGQSVMKVILVAPGCSSIYRTSVMKYLDWSGNTLVEDMDLTIQIYRKKLGQVAYEKRSIAYTQDPRNLKDYWGQMLRWATGTWQVVKKHRIPLGLQGIDFEFALLLGEGTLFSLVVVLLPLWITLYPRKTMTLFFIDQLLTLTIAVPLSIIEKRTDVLKYFFLFPFIRLIDCVVLLYSFWTIIVRNEKRTDWFSAHRYSQKSNLEKKGEKPCPCPDI